MGASRNTLSPLPSPLPLTVKLVVAPAVPCVVAGNVNESGAGGQHRRRIQRTADVDRLVQGGVETVVDIKVAANAGRGGGADPGIDCRARESAAGVWVKSDREAEAR